MKSSCCNTGLVFSAFTFCIRFLILFSTLFHSSRLSHHFPVYCYYKMRVFCHNLRFPIVTSLHQFQLIVLVSPIIVPLLINFLRYLFSIKQGYLQGAHQIFQVLSRFFNNFQWFFQVKLWKLNVVYQSFPRYLKTSFDTFFPTVLIDRLYLHILVKIKS